MSYDADLINAYRDQLARIRAAWKAYDDALKAKTRTYNPNFENLYPTLEDAINSTEADDIENLYKPQVPPVVDIRGVSAIALAAPPYEFFTWSLDDEDETPKDEER